MKCMVMVRTIVNVTYIPFFGSIFLQIKNVSMSGNGSSDIADYYGVQICQGTPHDINDVWLWTTRIS